MEKIRVNRQRGMSVDKKYGYADVQTSESVKCSPTIEIILNDMKKNISPINTLKRRIHRAWTINGPPCYWSVVRKSSHLKIYRSLPLKKNKLKKINDDDDLKNRKIDDKENNIMDYKNDMTINNNKNVDELDDNAKNNKNEVTKNNDLSGTKVKEKFKISDNNLESNINNSKLFDILNSSDTKLLTKINERKSNIPILRKNSREFEDISTTKESPKRSLIPQRYRGSTDDLRRSYRDEFNLPSLIPKLLSPQRTKNEKLNKKYQEGKETKSIDIIEKEIVNEEEISIDSKCSEVTNESVEVMEIDVLTKDTSDNDTVNVNELLKSKDRETIEKSKCEDSEELFADKDNHPELIVEKINEFEQKRYFKEEFSNTDDTDDAPNRRSSSHLSPEASPLSTRSSRYSPRESESEPTPGLPRKITGGESCISSQRIRDAITRTRRESNSSTRYESSGSESLRLSESGLRDYVDLARKVRLFGNNYYYPRASVESDEPVQRDSATSAGEDDPNDEFLSRNDSGRYTSTTASSQGRTILRRRRQFDSQGSRRRGRSHARTYCTDEVSHLQITRQPSPLRNHGANQTQDHLIPNPDYRRLVFISSDSSSGREEDDADSSCSGSSYLNGLPRNSHAQNLEDCDWDYFESDTIPLSSVLSSTIKSNDIIKNIKDSKSVWDCCPGRGSNACLACGGSPGRKVFPVPVPIPVPVPYPVPVPASLWNNENFAAAASSIITTTSSNEGLTLRNISPGAPWFSWHPRFNHPELFCNSIQRGAARITDSRFDPSIFTFEPDEITLERYEQIYGSKNLTISSKDIVKSVDKDNNENLENTTEENSKKKECLNSENRKDDNLIVENENKLVEDTVKLIADEQSIDIESNTKLSSMSSVCDEDAEEANEMSDSSSGRSSADSSDLEESTSHHRFSRIFVVNNDDDDDDDDDDEEENENEKDENDSLANNKVNSYKKMQVHDGKFDNSSIDNGIILNSVIPLLDEDPVILQCIKPIDNDFKDIDKQDRDDYLDDCIELKSIRNINPDDDILFSTKDNDSELSIEIKSWDSSVMPDSLEVIEETNKLYTINNIIDNNLHTIKNDSENSLTKNDIKLLSVNYNNGDGDNVKYKKNLSSNEIRTAISYNLSDYNLSGFVSSELSDINENVDEVDESLNDNDENEVNALDKSMKLLSEDDNESDKKKTVIKDDGERSSNSLRSGKEFDNNSKQVGENSNDNDDGGNDCEVSKNSGENRVLPRRGMPWFRSGSVERRPPTRKENVLPSTSLFVNNNKKYNNINTTKQNNNSSNVGSPNNKYKSLVMITQSGYQPVSVVTSDTTTLLQPPECETQSSQGLADYYHLALEALTEPHHKRNGQGPRRPLMVKRLNSHQSEQIDNNSKLNTDITNQSDDLSLSSSSSSSANNSPSKSNDKSIEKNIDNSSTVKSSTNLENSLDIDNNKLKALLTNDNINDQSGILILEEGLADDDSWVEEVSHDEDEQSCNTPTEESSEDDLNNFDDREEELRGYHRQAIDFTLHTIVEESCEESEAEPSLRSGHLKKKRPTSTSELAKYYFFGLGGNNNSINNNNPNNINNSSNNSNNNNINNTGNVNNSESNNPLSSREVDSLSETSSVYSEGLESLEADDIPKEKNNSNDFSNSSNLEKYFLSEFLAFDQDRRDSDGSVGSDSEGRPSPEAQRRKRLVRARGTGRSHSSSLDNLLALTQSSQNLTSQNSLQDLSINQDSQDTQSDDSSTETNGTEDGQTIGFGADGQFDTVKRKKKKPRNIGTQSPRINEDINASNNENEQVIDSDNERSKTPQPEVHLASTASTGETDRPPTSYEFNQRNKQQSRDSGFIGSCDDLLQHRKSPDDSKSDSVNKNTLNDSRKSTDQPKETLKEEKIKNEPVSNSVPPTTTSASLSRKDSFNNWSSDEETNLMMSKMRQFFKTMVANSSGQMGQSVLLTNNSSTTTSTATTTSSSPANINSLSSTIATTAAFSSSPRLSSSSKSRMNPQNRTKPPQLIYFENELTRLMKTVPGIRDEQVREIVEYLSSEDTWSDSYDSSDYTSSDLEGATSGRRSALQEQISQSCQQIIDKFDINSSEESAPKTEKEDTDENNSTSGLTQGQGCIGRDTAFVYHKLVQSFTKMAGDNVSSDTNSTPHSSPPLIAKVMHHIGSRLVALMHQVSEGSSNSYHYPTWRRYPQHNRTPSSASTTEDDDSTSDSNHTPVSAHFQLPRSKSHDPLLLINGHPTASTSQEGEERETSDYERFSWRGSFESALMAADSRTKLSLLACSGDINASASASALAMAAKRRSAGDLLFSPKSCSREQLDRVRSCGSIGVSGNPIGVISSGGSSSIEEKIWSNHRRSSVPDANTRTLAEEGTSEDDDNDEHHEEGKNDKGSTDDEFEYNSESRAKTLPRGMQPSSSSTSTTNSLPRLPITNGSPSNSTTVSSLSMNKAHSMYHFLPSQNTSVKSARYRPPGFARNSSSNNNNSSSSNSSGSCIRPKRAFSAPGLQAVGGSQNSGKQREVSRTRRREQAISLIPDDGSSLSEASSTPIIGGPRSKSSASGHNIMDIDDIEGNRLHSGLNLNTRASLSSLGARSDSMASIYSGAGEGRWCGSVTVRGEVEFSLQYDYKQLNLQVHISQCKDLAPVDIKRNRSDPYVKVYLLPDKSKSGKRKTKVKKHTLNPVFDETLKFHINLNNLETRTLWLTVWHSDMFGRNDFLGEVRMPLENKIFDDPTPQWYPLQERTEPFDDPVSYKGEVIVGLKFVPPDPVQLEKERESNHEHRILPKGKKNWSRGSLHVLVKEARHLQTRAKNSGTCDPFCKSYLLPDKGKSGKQKTNVVRRSDGSPVWSHTFVYKDVSLQELAERGLELTVWDHDRIGSNEFLGGVRFNLGNGKHYGKSVDWMDATGRELSLWQSMLERPNFWVEGAVILRPNLHNHCKSNTF